MRDHRRTSRWIALYAAAWLAATGVIVVAFAVLSRGGAPTVGVPPLAETRLEVAAHRAGCRLLGPRVAGESRLPVRGPATTRPTRAGIYERPQPPGALLAAIRRGTIVIEFGGLLPDGSLDALKLAQGLVPGGTILAPTGTPMPYAVAVRAYRHALACPRFTPRTLDALRLFRGRFLGTGPGVD